MYVRVNVWDGSIEEIELPIFHTLEDALNSLADELNMLVEDCGWEPDHCLVAMEEIFAAREAGRSGYITRVEILGGHSKSETTYWVIPTKKG